jgi:hypothetical protein
VADDLFDEIQLQQIGSPTESNHVGVFSDGMLSAIAVLIFLFPLIFLKTRQLTKRLTVVIFNNGENHARSRSTQSRPR